MNFHATPEQFQVDPTRAPPHNFDAEKALLGALLIDNGALERVVGFLHPSDFFDPLHQQIFETLVTVIGAGRSATPVTLRSFFETAPPVTSDLTVPQYLGHLVASATTTLNAHEYGRTVSELASRRRLIIVGEDLAQAAYFSRQSVPDIVLASAASLDDVSSAFRQGKRSVYSASGAGDAVLGNLDAVAGTSPTTGLVDLNKMLGGWPKGELSVAAGRPGMGKSAFAISALLRAARAGHGCQFFSLEMTEQQIGARMLTDMAYTNLRPILYQDLLRRNVQDLDRQRLKQARDILEKYPISIEEQRALSITDIATRARKLADKYDKDGGTLDVVFVDHMLLVKPSARYAGNRVREVAEISDGLASLAKELNCAVVALCQLNRGVEGRDVKRPTLSDLRDSGAIEEDASTVTFLYRPAYYLEQKRPESAQARDELAEQLSKQGKLLELIVAKNRNGATGIVDAFVDIGANAIRDWSSQ